MRSGLVTGLILAALVAVLAVAYRERGRGHYHKLKEKIVTQHQEAPIPRPGGQDAIVLTRSQMMGDSMPEFLSATMLPGRGMNVLQITAYIPGTGEVNLMASPSIEGAARAMTGVDADENGQASLAMGGAFEVPWADRIGGAASPSAHGSIVWRGHAITVPAAGNGGLMLAEAADAASTTALPDGGQAQAVFRAEDFGAHWQSKTEVTVTVLLSSRSVDLTVTAHNAGDVAEPVGIGWQPRFAILNGNRGELRLRIPGEKRTEMRDSGKRSPTGVLLPVADSPYDFTAPGGVRLGSMDLDDCFVVLHQGLLDSGPVAELSDPGRNYGLRLTALSSTIKAMHVLAPADGNFVSIEPQFNYPDPFGREWGKDVDTGMVMLQPGQSTQWKVRLELFSTSGEAAL
ncbi:MAG TPA: aldose 1-epimerase [Acidobacteriaceae bacterium]